MKSFLTSEPTPKSARHCQSDFISEERIPGKIPAIVSEDEFKTANEFIATHGRKYTSSTHLLRGNLLKCGCCGHALIYDKLADPVYRCYHTAADKNADCHKMKVSAEEINEIVLEAIRRKAQLVLDYADISKLRSKTADQQKIASCETAIQQNAEERQTLYERFALGEISRSEYLELKEECNCQFDRLKLQLAAMKSDLESGSINPNSVAAAKSALNENADNRELVETLIKSIDIFPNLFRVCVQGRNRQMAERVRRCKRIECKNSESFALTIPKHAKVIKSPTNSLSLHYGQTRSIH